MKRTNLRKAPEDTLKLAGWMYADMLLGLMVIFLATVSFLPTTVQVAGRSVTAPTKQIDRGYNYYQGYSIVTSSFSETNIRAQVAAFKKAQRIPDDSEIIFAQLLGGFDAKHESPDFGRNRALIYSYNLGKNLPDLFANSAMDVGSSSALNTNEVALRLTFTVKIK